MGGHFMLVTGEPGSGRSYWNESESEKYMIQTGRPVYVMPLKGFEIKSAKPVDLIRLGYNRKAGIYSVTVPDTIDRIEQTIRYLSKLSECMIIIPVSKEYAEIIEPVLVQRIEHDIDVVLIRDTVKDLRKVTQIRPDVFRIHADQTLPINQVYAGELAEVIGQDNAIAYLIAQWVVNSQMACNLKHDEMFKTGYFLYVTEGVIITLSDNPEARKSLREDILSEGFEMIKSRFAVGQTDDEIRDGVIDYLDAE